MFLSILVYVFLLWLVVFNYYVSKGALMEMTRQYKKMNTYQQKEALGVSIFVALYFGLSFSALAAYVIYGVVQIFKFIF